MTSTTGLSYRLTSLRDKPLQLTPCLSKHTTLKTQDKIMKKKLPLIREEVSQEEARKRIEAINEPYKVGRLKAG